MSNKLSKYLVTFLIILNILHVNAQINATEKRIYIIDLTASMKGKGEIKTPNVFEKVKLNLVETINQIEKTDTEITIITFTNKVHDTKTFYLNDRHSITNYITNLKILKGDTNIVDAWLKGIKELNPKKINYLFLLTDGLHNTGAEKNQLNDLIRNWSEISANTYNFAFYVMLTKHAKDMGIENAIKSSSQIWMIESLNVNATFLAAGKFLTVNVNSNKNIKILLKKNRVTSNKKPIHFKLKYTKNPYYKIKSITNNIAENGMITFEVEELKPLIKIPLEVKIDIELKNDPFKNSLTFFTPNKLHLKIINQGVRKMTFKEKLKRMKNLNRILVLITITSLSSCSINESKQDNNTFFDFGTKVYDEPFLFIPSHPKILEKSLKYTPKWLLTDTVILEKKFVIDFNEESIRFNSNVNLKIVDTLGKKLSGIDVYFNNIKHPNNALYITSENSIPDYPQEISIKLVINPKLGEQIIKG